MPEPNPQITDQEKQDIQSAKQSLARGEPESNITAEIIQSRDPNDPAQGYDYARYILAEARFALSQERPIIKEQPNMDNENDNRNHNSEQYRRDWAYAVRALEKGDTPEKVIKDMASFRKDLPDAQKYAETTVGKAQAHLNLRDELRNAARGKTTQAPDYTALDSSFRQSSHLDSARYMYEDGANRQTVTEFLQRERQLDQPDAANIAKDAEINSFAERDLNYAIRARERGEGDDRIVPKIAEYREKAIDNPQDYARAILEAADQVRQIERGHPNTSSAQQYIAAAQQQYRRDLQFAVFQLEHRTSDQVRLAIAERRPEKAYESPSYRTHGFADHSYAVAVADQATRIREVTERGRGLEEALDVAEREFGRHVQEAINLREGGRTANQITKQLGNDAGPGNYYARAVVNQADSIRNEQRQMSIRPEMARAAFEHTTPVHDRAPARFATTLER